MVGQHVAQGAGVFVKTATCLDPDGFSRSDLHMVNVMIVPEGFEKPVGETADQNILDGFLAQVMVNPVDLLLAHDIEQALIQCLSCLHVRAKRFFNDDPAKCIGGFLEQPAGTQPLHDFAEKAWCSGQVEHRIASAAGDDFLLQRPVGAVIQKIALHVADVLRQRGPQIGIQALPVRMIHLAGRFIANEVLQLFGKTLITDPIVVNAHNAQATVQ